MIIDLHRKSNKTIDLVLWVLPFRFFFRLFDPCNLQVFGCYCNFFTFHMETNVYIS